MPGLVKVRNLEKVYKTHKKKPGFKGSLKGFFSREYLSVRALKGISFDVEEGEFIGYIGPNGAGKTTTLKILSGLLYQTSGQVEVMGFTPQERKKEFLKNISFVMGRKIQLWWDLPAIETFELNKEIYEIEEGKFKEMLEYFTTLLDVNELIDIPVRNLSLGERMKFELINSILHDPDVIFLDEPTIGLDLIAQKKIRDFLNEYNREKKKTIILTSHYMRDVEELCKRIVILNKGEIIFDGTIFELKQKYLEDKFLEVTFLEKIPENIENYGNLVSREGLTTTIKIKKEKVPEVTSKLLKNFKVTEISISQEKIEEIIRDIFLNEN